MALKLRQWIHFGSQDQETEDVQNGKLLAEQRDPILWKLAQWHHRLLQKSHRWTGSAMDWSAEAREVLAHMELISDPKEL